MTYEMQAIIGIGDIGPMTFGELLHATTAKLDFTWTQTSSLMAVIANCHRDRHRRAYRPEDFYKPQLHRRERRPLTVDRLHGLKSVFTKKVS